MNKDEQEYVDGLKNEISRLEDEVKNLTEEKAEALAMAWKYLDKYIKDNNMSDEVSQGLKTLFNK